MAKSDTPRLGDLAPGFTLTDQHGNRVSSRSFRGRTLLIYFYPQADTPGCTVQARAVHDAKEDLDALGMDVVGISPDLPAEQRAFDEKYGLGFPLLSDPDHAVADAYGAWGTKTPDDEDEGVIRSSFLVDGDGCIAAAWPRVTPKETVPKAIQRIQELTADR